MKLELTTLTLATTKKIANRTSKICSKQNWTGQRNSDKSILFDFFSH